MHTRPALAPCAQTGTWGSEKEHAGDLSRYPHQLQFYDLPPEDEVSLEEFERLAVERLRVLKHVETAKVRWPKRGEEYDAYVREKTKVFLPLKAATDDAMAFEERRQDHVSHFILRLAYCRTEDLRRWFLTQECDLFRYRLEKLSSDEVGNFLQVHNLQYQALDEQEKLALASKLATCMFRGLEERIAKTDFFRVPFEQALELVRNRKAYVEAGYAIVARMDMTPIVVGAFRSRLSASLAMTARALPQLEEDGRLLPMLNSLSKQYLGKDYGSSTANGQVTPQDIPQLAAESFPLCMRVPHQTLTETHHLRHGARQQYGLFLKGIGMTLEDALAFWRSEFTRSISVDKFDKQYAYNIRHNYGKEGKRTSYTPYSCMRIIMSNAPAAGDSHGCPFRHYDADNLRARMLSYKVPAKAISEIMLLVKDQHYQLACAKYFDATHAVEDSGIAIQHPNQYFEESRKLRVGSSGPGMGSPGGSTIVSGAQATPLARDKAAPLSDEDLALAMDFGADALDDDDDMGGGGDS